MDSDEQKLADINDMIATAEKALDMMPGLKDADMILKLGEHYLEMTETQSVIESREFKLIKHLDKQLVIREHTPRAKWVQMASKRRRLKEVARRRATLTDLCYEVAASGEMALALRGL